MDKDLIIIKNNKSSWQEAIKLGVDLLEKKEYCTKELADKIINSVNKNGPYFIIMPKVALAHAEPGDHIKKIGLSLVKFNEPVKFSDNSRHDVNLLFTLSAKDAESHMELLLNFSNKFINDSELTNKIINCNSIDEIYEILKDI